ncbi:MAG: MFS transporter [Clostridia bacterium]
MDVINKIKEIHYGWIIVFSGFIIMAAALGIVYNCASLFIKPISQDLGFTRAQANALFTIRAICQVIAFLFGAKLFEKIRIRRLMQLVAIILAASFFSYSLIQGLASFYIITFIVSMSVALISILPLSIIISNWFHDKRGMAVGVAFMGSGIGGMIFSSLTGHWIETYGWRTTYQILAVIMFLMIAPITFFVIKTHPKDKGVEPYGYKTSSEEENNKGYSKEGLMFKEAISTLRFWILAISSVLVMLGINTIMATTGPHLSDAGYSITFSANVIALSMGSLAVGKVILGKLFDNLGSRWAVTVSSLAGLSAILGLLFADFTIALVAIIIGTGLGAAYGSIATTMVTVDMYGRKDYGPIFGLLSALGSTGAIIGPVLFGYLYDTTGSYNSSFIIAITLMVLAIIGMQYSLKRPYPKEEV